MFYNIFAEYFVYLYKLHIFVILKLSGMADKIYIDSVVDKSVYEGLKLLDDSLLKIDSTLDTLKKNPIEFSDIFKTGGGAEFKQNEKALNDLISQTKKLIELETAKTKLEAEKLKLQKIKIGQEKEDIKLQKEKEALTQKQIKTEKDKITLEQKQTQAQKKIVQETKDYNEILEQTIKTEKEAQEANKELRKARKELDTTTEDGRKEIEKINKAIDKNSKLIGENADKEKKRTLGIGKYKEGVKEALTELGIFGTVLNKAGGALESVSKGTKKGTKAMRAFKIALASTGIGLLVVAISTLIGFFAKSEAGGKKLKVIFAQIGAVIDTLTSRIANFGKGLYQILSGDFSEGLDTLKASFAGVADEIERNVKAATDLEKQKQAFQGLRRANEFLIAGLEKQAEIRAKIADDDTRSFKERLANDKLALQAQRAAIEARLETAKEAEKIAQNELQRGIDLKQNVEDLRGAANQASIERIQAEKDLELAQLEAAQRRRQILRDEFEQRLDFTLDVYDRQKAILEKQLSDESLTVEKRKQILNDIKEADKRNQNEIIDLYEKQTGKRIDIDKLIAENNIETLNDIIQNQLQFDEIEGNRLREVIIERQQYNQDLLDLDKDLNKKQKEEQQKKTEDQKELDNALFELRKELGIASNQELADAEIKALEERQGFKLLKAEEQAKAIRDIRIKYGLEAEQAAKESEEQQRKFSELSQEEKLNSIASVAGQAKELFKENTIAFKALAISEATINGYLAVQNALASVPPPLNFVVAAITGAAASLNVAKIAGVEIAEKGMYKVLDGKRHSEGGVSLGESGVEAESGEGMAIFSRSATSKYGNELEAFTMAANSGKLEDYYKNNTDTIFREVYKPAPFMVGNDNAIMEMELNKLNRSQQETNNLLKRFKFYDGNGMRDIWGNTEAYLN
jgi:hypothetical protein